MQEPEAERVWETGWDGHKQAQRLRFARLSLDEKLDWLEDAHQLVLQAQRPAAPREG